MPRHTPAPPLVPRHVLCRQIFFRPLTHWRLKEGVACSLESVSLLEDQVEVYAALQFGNVPLPPQGVVVNIVPLNSYNAELSPTLKGGEPKAPEFMASQTQLFFDVIEFPSFFHQGDWTILLQSFASKMTKLKQKHCKCIISPLFPVLFLRWQR